MAPQPRKDDQNDHPADSRSAAYEVHLTQAAETVYRRYFHLAQKATERGDLTNAHCTTLRQIDEALETLIPHDPLNPALALAGDLRHIYRMKKGRMRICWIASAAERLVYVLFISETLRKDGDANDPYKILSAMVRNGTCNQFFKELGIPLPPIAPSYLIQ